MKNLIIILSFLAISSYCRTEPVFEKFDSLEHTILTGISVNHQNILSSGNYSAFDGDSLVYFTFLRLSNDFGATSKFIYKFWGERAFEDNPRNIFSINLLTSKRIIDPCQYGLILHSEDGGDTWDSTFFNFKNNVYNRSFIDTLTGIIYYEDAESIIYTKDGGKTWDSIELPKDNYLVISQFPISNVILADTSTIIISFFNTEQQTWTLRTTNLGKSWDFYNGPVEYAPAQNYYNRDIGWATGCINNKNDRTPVIYLTEDGAKTWKKVLEDKTRKGFIQPIIIENETTISASSGTVIYRTTDKGNTWKVYNTNIRPGDGITDMSGTSIDSLVLISFSKYLKFKLETGIDDQIVINENDDLFLSPNPASDFIEISVPTELNQRFKSLVQDIHVYYTFGEEVPIPNCFESVSSSAYHCSFRLDVSGFVPGVYFVKIGDRVQRFVKI